MTQASSKVVSFLCFWDLAKHIPIVAWKRKVQHWLITRYGYDIPEVHQYWEFDFNDQTQQLTFIQIIAIDEVRSTIHYQYIFDFNEDALVYQLGIVRSKNTHIMPMHQLVTMHHRSERAKLIGLGLL